VTDYSFGDLPVGPAPAGTTFLVTASDSAGSRLARDLALAGNGGGEGTLVVTTDDSGRATLEDCLAGDPDLATDRLAVVDASGADDTETDTDAYVGSVSNTGDLTGISIQFSIAYSRLHERGVDRIRTCVDAVSTLLLYADFRTITRFVHTLVGRISKSRGLGAFVLDPEMHEPQVTKTLQRLCTARLDVRRAGDGHELKIDGLRGQPNGWQPLRF